MRFKDLRELTREDAGLYTKYYEESETELADACPNSRIAWNVGYHYHYAIIEDCFVPVSDGGVFTRPHFALPLGRLNQEKLNAIVEEMRLLFQEEGWPLRSMFIDESYVSLYDQVPGLQPVWIQNDDLSDYLYDAEKLRTLKGHSYRGKRNHINQFVRNYPAFEYRRIQKEDRETALKLVSNWCEEKQIDCMDPNQSDYLPIATLFDAWDFLQIRGGILFVDGQAGALGLGSLVHKDRAVMHFEKARDDYDGLFAVINKLVLMEEFPEAVMVNREEDMGIAGLREAKESYLPVRMIKKYEMTGK